MPKVPGDLARAAVLDEKGSTHPLSELWAARTAVLVFLRHFS